MDHNIFMKQIVLIVVILNQSEFFFSGGRVIFMCCGFLEFFLVWKPGFWIFIEKNFLVKQILKCPSVKNNINQQIQKKNC